MFIDTQKDRVVDPSSRLESKEKYFSLAGKNLKGEVSTTIVRGEVIYSKEGRLLARRVMESY